MGLEDKMRIKDFIMVLSECDLLHQESQTENESGLCQSDYKRIIIMKGFDPIVTYATIIHEALHYHYDKKAIHKTEKQIEAEERELMKRWFRVTHDYMKDDTDNKKVSK